MDDLKPFKHGSEGTHSACRSRVIKEGASMKCCTCVPHEGCDMDEKSLLQKFEDELLDVGYANEDGLIVVEPTDFRRIAKKFASDLENALMTELKNN